MFRTCGSMAAIRAHLGINERTKHRYQRLPRRRPKTDLGLIRSLITHIVARAIIHTHPTLPKCQNIVLYLCASVHCDSSSLDFDHLARNLASLCTLRGKFSFPTSLIKGLGPLPL